MSDRPFVALALGAALLATMGLVLTATIAGRTHEAGRLALAPVIVRASQELAVGFYGLALEEPRGLPLGGLPSGVVDRTFYAQPAGGPATSVGHGWSSAAYGGYRLMAGRPPSSAREVVVPGGVPGERVTVLTADGPRAYTVSGVSAPVAFESAVIEKVRAIPGTRSVVSAPTTVYTVPPGSGGLVVFSAQVVDGTDLLNLPVLSGRAGDLDGSSVIVDETWNRGVGERVRLWLADGRPLTLRVAAVTRAGTGAHGAILTHAGTVLPDAMYVSGAAPAALAAALGSTAVAVPTAQWTASTAAAHASQARTALLVVGGIAVLYTAVSIANTLAMSTRRRGHELTLLRRVGATRAQVLRMLAAEGLLVAALGALLAAAAVTLSLGGLWLGLRHMTENAPLTLPLLPFAIASSALPAAFRRR